MRFLPIFVREADNAAPVQTTLRQAFWRLKAAWMVRRQRRALMALDDRMLADIGLSRSQAYREASRPFGDLPQRMV
jgi:uncharacterized protein YjiS (DUF1127 family)